MVIGYIFFIILLFEIEYLKKQKASRKNYYLLIKFY